MSRLALVVLLVGCSGSSSDAGSEAGAPPASTTTPTSGVTTTTGSTDATPAHRGDCPNRLPGSSPSEVTIDGTYAATVSAFDDGTSELSVDVVQWLVGDDANEAYAADTGDDGGAPNDYYVVNASTQVRSMPVSDDAAIWLVRLTEDADADVSSGTIGELAGYLANGGSGSIWWVTLDAGTVVELCEQYTP